MKLLNRAIVMACKYHDTVSQHINLTTPL